MQGVDANLVAVQWGLLGVFGVVVGLLIAPADRFLQDFLASGEPADQKRAFRWAASLKVTSVLVFFALVGLSFVGAQDANLSLRGPFVIGSWVLLTPVAAQAGFVILVLCLVKWVPQLVTLRLEQPPDGSASPAGRRDPAVICFVNETTEPLQVWWLDYDGHKEEYIPALAAGAKASQSTYQGHRFLIATAQGLDVCTVEAAATPACATIKPENLKSYRAETPIR